MCCVPISPLSEVALYNAASEQAQGEYLVLLAADSEVVNPNWIDSLLNHAQRPEVGVVGAKLVDRDGNMSSGRSDSRPQRWRGLAIHRRKTQRRTRVIMQRLTCSSRITRRCPKVCLMVRKELFDALGGLDEQDVYRRFHADVDLCLKALARPVTWWCGRRQAAGRCIPASSATGAGSTWPRIACKNGADAPSPRIRLTTSQPGPDRQRVSPSA
jgi:hypothetical protein